MDSFELDHPAIPPSPHPEASATAGARASARIVELSELRDRREATPLPCDDLRQWTVVVWARTKLLERLLAAQGPVDPRLLAGLADIDAAVVAIGTRLDALEDALPRRAA